MVWRLPCGDRRFGATGRRTLFGALWTWRPPCITIRYDEELPPREAEFKACRVRLLRDRLVAHPQRSGQGSVLPLLAAQLSHQWFLVLPLFYQHQRQDLRDVGRIKYRNASPVFTFSLGGGLSLLHRSGVELLIVRG